MDLEIEGKAALVVGAGRGIGRAVAIKLAAAGANVAIVARTQSELDAAMHDMGGSSMGHWACAADLTEDAAADRLIGAHNAHRSGPDIVVYNLGGTLNVKDPLCATADWRRVQRLNLEVAMELNRLTIPAMQQRGWGRVVHVSSIAAQVTRGALAYGVAKAALNAYVTRLGFAVAASGVAVTAVMPGAIASPGSTWEVRQRNDPDQVKRYLEDHVAARRFASVEEIAEFITFLCSRHASYFAGTVLAVDGGTV